MPDNRRDYDNQRPRVIPPLVPIRELRRITGKTLDEVCAEVREITGKPFTKGALSAIENGHRGASAETLHALEVVYDLTPGCMVIGYQPTTNTRRANGAAA